MADPEKTEDKATAKSAAPKPQKITLACAYHGPMLVDGEMTVAKAQAGDEVTLPAAELAREPNLDADSPDNQRVAQLVAMQAALQEAGGRPELRDKLAFTLAAAKPRAPRAG